MNKARNGLHIQAIVLIGFLILQYALGMAANLFVPFPPDAGAGQSWRFAWTQILVASHIVIGILLVIGAAVFVVRSIRKKDQAWIILSSLGLLAILVAGVSGTLFITTKGDWYSYAMSLAFLIAFIAYGWGAYASRPGPNPR